MTNYSVSKSRYCNFIQCPKMLWLKKEKNDLYREDVVNPTLFANGNAVGDLAMGIFGDFTEVPYGDLSEMICKTEELLKIDTKIIAEASFSYDNCFCSIDILRNLGNKDVEFYEVKSSTNVSDIYKDDISYQYFVLTKLGYHVKKASLIYIDKNYIRQKELDLNKLFIIQDFTQEAISNLARVESNIKDMRKYLSQTQEPNCIVDEHCHSPYNCGFWHYCVGNLPLQNVFNVSGFYQKNKYECYKNNIISFNQLLEHPDLLTKNHKMQIEWEIFNKPPFIDEKEIRKFMKDLTFPLYFLDFESFQPPIPLFENSRPYQQIVFQYSLHYILEEGGELFHKEFLASPGTDPRREFAEQLCKDIPSNGSVIVYNKSFERPRMNELAALFPDLAPKLKEIVENIKDLMIPFQKKWYYSKEMEGSHSIKKVLPALFPNDEKLDYSNLDGVHQGGEASAAFLEMQNLFQEGSPESLKEIKKKRKELLEYCWLDTYAMVKLWEKLKSI
ncbi:MAG: DUF2779 domain-containing protein [Treponema sp.]|nr:DUF2779 domain-containing protein [Treponema sp.]